MNMIISMYVGFVTTLMVIQDYHTEYVHLCDNRFIPFL